MATRLGKFELPNRLVKEEETANEKYAKFIADPFESGYGHTIGNAFRRVLLSSIEGAAISSSEYCESYCKSWEWHILNRGLGWEDSEMECAGIAAMKISR